jgi:hypothetical protein
VAREREVDARHKPLEIARTLPLALPLEHHLRQRLDVHRKAAGFRL